MKKLTLLSSATVLLIALCALNVHLLTKSKSAQTAGIVLNKALASGEYNDDDYIMNDDDPIVLEPMTITTTQYDPTDYFIQPIDHVDITADAPSVIDVSFTPDYSALTNIDLDLLKSVAK